MIFQKTFVRIVFYFIAVFMVLVAHPSKSFAQLFDSRVGIKFGGNVSYWNLPDVTSIQFKPGYNVGSFIRLQFTHPVAIQPEATYFSQRMDFTTTDNENVQHVTSITMHKFEFSTMVVFNPGRILDIHAGPYAWFLGDVKATNNDAGRTALPQVTVSKADFEDVEYGLAAGAGVTFLGIMGGLRLYHGLSNMGKEAQPKGTVAARTSMNPFRNTKDNSCQLYLAVTF